MTTALVANFRLPITCSHERSCTKTLVWRYSNFRLSSSDQRTRSLYQRPRTNWLTRSYSIADCPIRSGDQILWKVGGECTVESALIIFVDSCYLKYMKWTTKDNWKNGFSSQIQGRRSISHKCRDSRIHVFKNGRERQCSACWIELAQKEILYNRTSVA